MLKISPSIRDLDHSDISDNLYYYNYNIKHLLSLKKKGIAPDDPHFLSSYRSFEGEVFENYVYEKLLRYAIAHSDVEVFILKGPHKKSTAALPNTLSVNAKGQIVYRNRSKEIGEFDALIVTTNEIYFVEMTLVKSVTNLKRRLRKKRALLQTIFPKHDIKALIVLNDGATGIKQLPDYCVVWVTKPYDAMPIFEHLSSVEKSRLRPFERFDHHKLGNTSRLQIESFNYYGTLAWIFKKLRSGKALLNMGFLTSKTVTRYVDLFTKIYIGYMDAAEFKRMVPAYEGPISERVIVSIEKEHTNELLLTYFMAHTRKNLDKVNLQGGEIKVIKKDPFGISVTEVAHMDRQMDESHKFSSRDIDQIEHILGEHNAKLV
ncbi:MAG: hypothetical protein JXK05_10880 [Campylobacterales bacterium]|nr:hypothetical protein [Campylobacterales bacterium]